MNLDSPHHGPELEQQEVRIDTEHLDLFTHIDDAIANVFPNSKVLSMTETPNRYMRFLKTPNGNVSIDARASTATIDISGAPELEEAIDKLKALLWSRLNQAR